MTKKYVNVIVKFDTNGNMTPLSVIWDGDKSFVIDKILDTCTVESFKDKVAGIRYTCKIESREIYLFLEDNKWFVEAK